jgi:large subunit ribosomal protein L24
MRLKIREKQRHNVTIRKGDQVRVMTGRDKEAFRHKTSRVLSVDPVTLTVTVEHAHMIKRHTRPNPQKNVKGGIVEREGPIHISNVMLVCPGCNKPTRIAHKLTAGPDGKMLKDRICRKCGATL